MINDTYLPNSFYCLDERKPEITIRPLTVSKYTYHFGTYGHKSLIIWCLPINYQGYHRFSKSLHVVTNCRETKDSFSLFTFCVFDSAFVCNVNVMLCFFKVQIIVL